MITLCEGCAGVIAQEVTARGDVVRPRSAPTLDALAECSLCGAQRLRLWTFAAPAPHPLSPQAASAAISRVLRTSAPEEVVAVPRAATTRWCARRTGCAMRSPSSRRIYAPLH